MWQNDWFAGWPLRAILASVLYRLGSAPVTRLLPLLAAVIIGCGDSGAPFATGSGVHTGGGGSGSDDEDGGSGKIVDGPGGGGGGSETCGPGGGPSGDGDGDGSLRWGRPDGPPVVGGGNNSACGLKMDGTVVCWPGDQAAYPGNDYIGVDCGLDGCLLQRANGQLIRRLGSRYYEIPVGKDVKTWQWHAATGGGVLESGEGRFWRLGLAQLEDEYGRPVYRGGPYGKTQGSVTALVIAAIDPAPGTKFRQIDPNGCAIKEDGSMVILGTNFDRSVRQGPSGEFRYVVRCDPRPGSTSVLDAPQGDNNSGMAIKEDGTLVNFVGDTSERHSELKGDNYWKGTSTVGFTCVLTTTGVLQCAGSFEGIIDPTVQLIGAGASMNATPDQERFTQLTGEGETSGGKGRMLGVTESEEIWLWGDQGGNAMKPPPEFPFQ